MTLAFSSFWRNWKLQKTFSCAIFCWFSVQNWIKAPNSANVTTWTLSFLKISFARLINSPLLILIFTKFRTETKYRHIFCQRTMYWVSNLTASGVLFLTEISQAWFVTSAFLSAFWFSEVWQESPSKLSKYHSRASLAGITKPFQTSSNHFQRAKLHGQVVTAMISLSLLGQNTSHSQFKVGVVYFWLTLLKIQYISDMLKEQ